MAEHREPETHPDYEALPEIIKAMYSEREYAWLGAEERGRLIERECIPEHPGEP